MCIKAIATMYAMVDRRGGELKKDRFRTRSEDLEQFASDLPEGSKVAIESSASVQASSCMRSSMTWAGYRSPSGSPYDGQTVCEAAREDG